MNRLGYAPQFFGGVQNPETVKSVMMRAQEIMTDISRTRLVLHGLNAGDSVLAIWKLLFSPKLQKHFGSGESFEWTKRLVANFADGTRFDKRSHMSFQACIISVR